ncbi:MAG: ECF-type sigma factor [Thermoanaerobaculia bacterium]
MSRHDRGPGPAAALPITQLLAEARAGDRDAEAAVYAAVYEDLQRLARGQKRRLRLSGQTLDTTALVHESYLRLAGSPSGFNDREHFMAVAATAMRQVLVDRARKRGRAKRGGGERPVTLDESVHSADADREADILLALDEALRGLDDEDPRLRRVVECQFFGGMTRQDTAAALELSERTVRRLWIKARAWLRLQLDAARP